MATAEEWRDALSKRMDARYWELRKFDDYYAGDHKLQFASTKFREAFGTLFSEFSDNFCELVVDAVEERLNVEGFRMGTDAQADVDAWRIWQANGLDADSQIAHTEALIKGECAVIVSPYKSEWPQDDAPLITVEDPMEVIVATSPHNRRQRIAALKRWIADDRVHATLFTSDALYKWQSKNKRSDWPSSWHTELTKIEWEPRLVEGEEWPLENPLGVVPVIPLVNKPRRRDGGQSEIASVIPIQNAVNKVVSDMLLAAEFGAFPQRYGINIEPEIDKDTGQPKEPFKVSVDRLWLAPPPNNGEPETKFGQFTPTDLAPYVKAVEMLVQHVASITRTPPHYLLGQSGLIPSGESLKSTETGLVAKSRRKMRHFGESWEEVIRVAFKAMGDSRSEIVDSQTIWKDPESRTEAELVDALVKMGSLGVPKEALWERWGATPQEIARWRGQLAAQSLLQPPTPLRPVPEEGDQETA